MWGGGIFAPAVTVWFRTLESIKMRNTLVQTATRVGLDQFVFAPCVLSGMFLFLDCGSCGISEMCTVSRCAGWGRRMLDGSLERLWSSVFFLGARHRRRGLLDEEESHGGKMGRRGGRSIRFMWCDGDGVSDKQSVSSVTDYICIGHARFVESAAQIGIEFSYNP
jgi:hypothetical protein